MRFILIACLTLSLVTASAQNEIDELAYYADVMINASADQHRTYAAQKFKSLFDQELAKPNSYNNAFESLDWIAIEYPADSTFRILSWQLMESENKFTYYNLLQKSSGEIIPLIDGITPDADFEYESLDPTAWYGLLIYDIKKVKDKEDTYLLFGMHQEDKEYKTKVVDVLEMKDGNINLGVNIFVSNPGEERLKYKKRIFLRYTATAAVNLNFNPGLDAIVYDHIIAHLAGGSSQILVPDGSYEAYKYEDNQWVYVEKVFDLIMDEPPMTRKKPETQKDIFGRKDLKKRKVNKR